MSQQETYWKELTFNEMWERIGLIREDQIAEGGNFRLNYGGEKEYAFNVDHLDRNRPIEVDGNWLDRSEYEDVWYVEQKSVRQVKHTETKSQTTEQNTMAKSIANVAIDTNKAAIQQAAKIAVGTAGNQLVKNAIKPAVPMIMRGYLDSVVGNIIVANIAALLVNQLASDNEKAVVVAQAMADAAMIDLLSTVDIAGLVDQLTAGVDSSKLELLMKAKAE